MQFPLSPPLQPKELLSSFSQTLEQDTTGQDKQHRTEQNLYFFSFGSLFIFYPCCLSGLYKIKVCQCHSLDIQSQILLIYHFSHKEEQTFSAAFKKFLGLQPTHFTCKFTLLFSYSLYSSSLSISSSDLPYYFPFLRT